MQAFVIQQEGVLFKWVERGSPASASWRTFIMEKGRCGSVGSLQ